MWTVAGLLAATVVEAGAGLGVFVLGCLTVMAQFIFTMASLLHEGRPKMGGPRCLQHTSMNLHCGIEHQGGLAAK